MRPARAFRFLPLLALLAAAPGGVPAASAETGTESDAARVYAVDNAIFTLYHEFGHLFVDRFSLPVLAREEDAVDNLATLMALEDYDRDGGGVLGYAVYGWELAVNEESGGAPDAQTLYSVHSLTAQRAYTMVCLLVGKDKAVFGEAATSWGIDDERQDDCAHDYVQAKSSWDMVLAPHRRGEGAAEAPVAVSYEPASIGTAGAKQLLTSRKVLERVAARLESEFAMPEGVVLKAADCGSDNAYYDSDEGSVTLCYEIVNYYLAQYADAPGGSVPEDEDEETAAEGETSYGLAQSYRGPVVNRPNRLP